jgi:hypothetical protein
MAMNAATAVAKVERLLEQHDTTLAVVRKHAERYADAKARLDSTDGDLEMYAQHRAVTDDLREKVSAALAESAALGETVPDDAAELTADENAPA